MFGAGKPMPAMALMVLMMMTTGGGGGSGGGGTTVVVVVVVVVVVMIIIDDDSVGRCGGFDGQRWAESVPTAMPTTTTIDPIFGRR
jgi:hypothetical protein